MKYHLVSGACGFVGRNLVKRILKSNNDRIIIVDNLSTGIHPDKWLSNPSESLQDLAVYENGRVYFFNGDFRVLLNKMTVNQNYIQDYYGLAFDKFTDVFQRYSSTPYNCSKWIFCNMNWQFGFCSKTFVKTS